MKNNKIMVMVEDLASLPFSPPGDVLIAISAHMKIA